MLEAGINIQFLMPKNFTTFAGEPDTTLVTPKMAQVFLDVVHICSKNILEFLSTIL